MKDHGIDPEQVSSFQRAPYGPDVLGDTFIVCLECGRRFRSLGVHTLSHGLDADEYKEKWGYNAGQGLVARDLADKKSRIATELEIHKRGKIRPGQKGARKGPSAPAESRGQLRHDLSFGGRRYAV